jgi:rubredoxin
MRDYFNIKINVPGGIASPGYLKELLQIMRTSQVRYLRLAARQQLLFTVHYEEMRAFEKQMKALHVAYQVNSERFPNIISSYCGEEVFRTGQWLGANEYHSILESFDFQPLLKVNISDSNQSFTPFFTGNLNFISSPEPHFWYLYIRPKQGNALVKWRDLIYTNDIGRIARTVESFIHDQNSIDEENLYNLVKAKISYIAQPAVEDLELPSFSLPYYEGFNRYESRTWLGLYRRDELFSIEFLLDLSTLCLKSRIGEICLTPWKSLIIKGIEDPFRQEWSNILGKHNINVRHAANELAWQTEDQTDEGTRLKKDLIRYIEKNDTRTFGLCFGIQTRPKSEVFGSILIRRRPLLRIGQLALFSVYDLYYTENFNPNNRKHILFEKGLFKIHLAGQVVRLCRKFNNRRWMADSFDSTPAIEENKPVFPTPKLHQCPDCLTVYHEKYGDVMQHIKPGTPFLNLPPDYCCATCGTSRSEMIELTTTEKIPV